MVCEKVNCCQVDLVAAKNGLLQLGFEEETLADLIKRHGEVIIHLIVEAMQNGISRALVMEIITNLGPFFLDLFSKLFQQSKMMKLDSTGMVSAGLIEALLNRLMEKIDPNKLVETIVAAIVKILSS